MADRMTAAEFRGWRLAMRHHRNWYNKECAAALGCGINSIYQWSQNGAPHYVALACMAMADEAKPWSQTEDDVTADIHDETR